MQLSDLRSKWRSDRLNLFIMVTNIFIELILVSMWMVLNHHVVFSILIIMFPHHRIIRNNLVRTIQLIKQRQQRLLIAECIDVNHFCTNVTATMIFHQNVFRAIHPSDLNCKQLEYIQSIEKERERARARAGERNRGKKTERERKKRKEKKEYRLPFFAPSFLFFSLFSFSFRDRSFVFFLSRCQLYPWQWWGTRLYV